MEIIFAMLVGFTWQILRFCVRSGIRKMRVPKAQSACADCFYAHVQYTANARCAISCTYGGAVRPMKLNVLYCTDYRARNMPLRVGVIGFVREIAPMN
jgi:hypothetical protein